MTHQPRPRTSSRSAGSRPRRVAGQGAPAAPRTTAAPDGGLELEEPPYDEVGTAEPEPEPEPEVEGEITPDDDPVPEGPAAAVRPGLFAGTRVTVALLVAIVVLTAATLAMAGYLWLSDDEPGAATPPPEGEIAVPTDRPILLPWSDAQAAASAAAESATTAIGTSWKDYDAQVDEAVALMTPSFGEEFRETATDSRAGIVGQKIEVTARVLAQSVVRANSSEVQALLFLDQYSTTQGTGTTVSPYRLLVTMVHTDGGWLISDLETK